MRHAVPRLHAVEPAGKGKVQVVAALLLRAEQGSLVLPAGRLGRVALSASDLRLCRSVSVLTAVVPASRLPRTKLGLLAAGSPDRKQTSDAGSTDLLLKCAFLSRGCASSRLVVQIVSLLFARLVCRPGPGD